MVYKQTHQQMHMIVACLFRNSSGTTRFVEQTTARVASEMKTFYQFKLEIYLQHFFVCVFSLENTAHWAIT